MAINGAPINSNPINGRKFRLRLVIDPKWLIRLGERVAILKLYGRGKLVLLGRRASLKIKIEHLTRLLQRIATVESHE